MIDFFLDRRRMFRYTINMKEHPLLLHPKVVRENDCYLWPTIRKDGYSNIIRNGKKQYVHRYIYEQCIGPIPKDKEIHHVCNRRNCLNPNHLVVVTHRENLMAGNSFSAINAKKTHCPAGHLYNEENTRVDKRNYRYCKQCRRERDKRINRRGP